MAKSPALVVLFKPKRQWSQFSLKSLLIGVTLGCVWLSIEAEKPTGIRFADVAKLRGLDCRRPPRPLDPLPLGGGCALADFDDDGWQDALLVDRPYPRLYRNTGHGWFQEITASAGLAQLSGVWTGCAVGDYDGDGRLDLLLTGRGCLALLHNAGASFDNATDRAGLDPHNQNGWGGSAGWMDLDGDGWLDLVVLKYVGGPEGLEPAFGEIWRNDGCGRFELVPASQAFEDTNALAVSLAFCDVDDDGRMDFYVGNDGTKAELMHNQGGMIFKNVGVSVGLAVARDFLPLVALGADWADFNRDGRLDLAVADSRGMDVALFRHDVFFKDTREPTHAFTEIGSQAQISRSPIRGIGFGVNWLDMDNDGWPDLCCPRVDAQAGTKLRAPFLLFRNQLGRQFAGVELSLGDGVRRPVLGRGSAAGDFNNDGRSDVLIVDAQAGPMLLLNRTRNDNHWLALDLRGRPPNVFAYGAKITARAGSRTWVGQVSPASSYLSSSDPRIHWGLGTTAQLDTLTIIAAIGACPARRRLGTTAQLDTLTIRWPSGSQDILSDVAADQIVRVVEGMASAPRSR